MAARLVMILTFLCSACAMTTEAPNYSNEVKYAMSYCLSTAYPDAVFSKDAGYISGALLQKGRYGLDMYESIRAFVDLYRQEKYSSKHNRNLAIMQCLDLSTSTELLTQVRKIADKAGTEAGYITPSYSNLI